MKFLNFNFIVRNLTTLRTNVRYPNVERGWFKNLKIEDINFFKSILLPSQVIIDEAIIDSYNTDWLKECKGCSQLLLRPYSTTEISKILQYCNQERLAIVPQGGNTGLAHGSIPVFDEIILSMSSMNKVKYIDSLSGIMVCEAGCVLKTLEDTLSEKGMIMPYDLGARDSCQIGGNIATHAGGVRFVRYGPLRAYVVGLEAVLPNGEILDCMNTVRKDNTGYDLKQLFIGSEGTLGVITKVALYCPPKPADTCTAFYGCNNFEDIIEAFKLAKSQLGETLSAFEFMDQDCMRAVQACYGLTCPFAQTRGDKSTYPYYFIIQTASSNLSGSTALNDSLVEFCAKISDSFSQNQSQSTGNVILAQTLSEQTKIWNLRKNIYPALCDLETKHKIEYAKIMQTMPKSNESQIVTDDVLQQSRLFESFDISLPIIDWERFIQTFRAFISENLGANKDQYHSNVCFCGHFGDQNIHVICSISPRQDIPITSQQLQTMAELKFKIETFLYGKWPALEANNGGGYSYSAEHGMGLAKSYYLLQNIALKSKNSLNTSFESLPSLSNNTKWSYMRQIKNMFDPHGIMNPYKIFGK